MMMSREKARDFRGTMAKLVSYLGDWFNLLASAALITALTGSGTAISWLFLARFLPLFFVSPLAGVVADLDVDAGDRSAGRAHAFRARPVEHVVLRGQHRQDRPGLRLSVGLDELDAGQRRHRAAEHALRHRRCAVEHET